MNSALDSLPNRLLDHHRELPSVDDVLEALNRYREATEDRMTPPFAVDDSHVDTDGVEALGDSDGVEASGETPDAVDDSSSETTGGGGSVRRRRRGRR